MMDTEYMDLGLVANDVMHTQESFHYTAAGDVIVELVDTAATVM